MERPDPRHTSIFNDDVRRVIHRLNEPIDSGGSDAIQARVIAMVAAPALSIPFFLLGVMGGGHFLQGLAFFVFGGLPFGLLYLYAVKLLNKPERLESFLGAAVMLMAVLWAGAVLVVRVGIVS